MTDDIRFMESENKVILQLSGPAVTDEELVSQLYQLYRRFKRKYSARNFSTQKSIENKKEQKRNNIKTYDEITKIDFLKRAIKSYKPTTYFTANDMRKICKNLDYEFTASTMSEYLRRLSEEDFLIRNEDERPITYGLVEQTDPLLRYEFIPEKRIIKVLNPQITKD